MKLRKLAAAALTAALTLSLAVPAMAADAADAQLTKVTQAVKATLAVGDEYESFYGEPSQTALPESVGQRPEARRGKSRPLLPRPYRDPGQTAGPGLSGQGVHHRGGGRF